MKIAEIKGRVLKVPRFPYRWRDGFPRAPAERDGFLLQVIADNGVEGHCIATRRRVGMADRESAIHRGYCKKISGRRRKM